MNVDPHWGMEPVDQLKKVPILSIGRNLSKDFIEDRFKIHLLRTNVSPTDLYGAE